MKNLEPTYHLMSLPYEATVVEGALMKTVTDVLPGEIVALEFNGQVHAYIKLADQCTPGAVRFARLGTEGAGHIFHFVPGHPVAR